MASKEVSIGMYQIRMRAWWLIVCSSNCITMNDGLARQSIVCSFNDAVLPTLKLFATSLEPGIELSLLMGFSKPVFGWFCCGIILIGGFVSKLIRLLVAQGLLCDSN